MISIPEDQMEESTGFTVYDAETGEPAEAVDAVRFSVKGAEFVLRDEGQLAVVYCDTWEDVNIETLPRQGKYLIQFGDGKYMRW